MTANGQDPHRRPRCGLPARVFATDGGGGRTGSWNRYAAWSGFPVRDWQGEQDHMKGSQLRVVNDVLGHLALFGIAPTYMPQIDQHLSELLATEV